MAQQVSSSSVSHTPLMDVKRDIFDTLYTIKHLSLYQEVILNHKKSPIFMAMVRLGVLAAFVPRTHLFPEFIQWLASTMYPKKCFVMNQSRENVFQGTSQLIHQALNYLVSGTYTTFTKESLISYYDSMSPQELSHVTSFLAPKSSQFSLDGNIFSLEMFVVDISYVLQVIAKILGKEDSNLVDKFFLGFLSLMMKPEVVLDIPTFWVDAINTQFMTLPLTGSFKFPSVITYLFLY